MVDLTSGWIKLPDISPVLQECSEQFWAEAEAYLLAWIFANWPYSSRKHIHYRDYFIASMRRQGDKLQFGENIMAQVRYAPFVEAKTQVCKRFRDFARMYVINMYKQKLRSRGLKIQ